MDFGEQYAPAAETLRILALGVLIARYTCWINLALLAVGRRHKVRIYVITTVACLVPVSILVMSYFYEYAAIAYLGFAVMKSVLSFLVFGYLLKKWEEQSSL